MLDDTLFNHSTALSHYKKIVWRVVEAQEEAATLKVVDDIEEQMLLEALLDEIKPKYRTGTEVMHYLLKTAFRYPPLRHGSRFGTNTQPSYFYASEEVETALSECAYYRFLFLEDMDTPYTDPIRSEFCVFTVLVHTQQCLDLSSSYFSAISDELTNPSNYSNCQAIGKWADARGDVELIRFLSARYINGVNVAVSEPTAIHSKTPLEKEKWLCLTKPDSISFSSRGFSSSQIFTKEQYSDKTSRLLRV